MSTSSMIIEDRGDEPVRYKLGGPTIRNLQMEVDRGDVALVRMALTELKQRLGRRRDSQDNPGFDQDEISAMREFNIKRIDRLEALLRKLV